MAVDPLAGRPAPPDRLIDLDRLQTAYFAHEPDPADPSQRVQFGTSGHRGSPLSGTFNEAHVIAITRAICEYRRQHGVDGPLYVGADTHALSEPARRTALEVLAANEVETFIDSAGSPTPTPVVSHAILVHNRGRTAGLADGIVITPSHNPPEDGGFKYNPANGGPADTSVTHWIEERANALLSSGIRSAARLPYDRARSAPTTHSVDYRPAYVDDLASVVDMERIKAAGLTIGVDPLGGAAAGYWDRIAERYGLQLEIVNRTVDPRFAFMTLDWDGRIRMDCSSPYAMARLIGLKDRFDLAFGNDPDADRHGIVTRSAGLMNPNHYLAAAIDYLFAHRPAWRADAAVGKTMVSSSLIDRVAVRAGRRLAEVPVGFKWFVPGLLDGSLGFGGEESAGASFLRRDGTVWTTDKDGIIMGLLAVEMLAVTARDPSQLYAALTSDLGAPVYERVDAPITPQQKEALLAVRAGDVHASTLAGDVILATLTSAPANGAPIGGLKVVTAGGWFAARPSGTEAVYKLYAESFRGPDHLRRIQAEARSIVADVLAARSSPAVQAAGARR
jgi:phosphoglucomutase